MNENYNKLHKLVENLKEKISKLDNKSNKISNYRRNCGNCGNCGECRNHKNHKNIFLSYRISAPCTNDCNKKFIGLLFNNFDEKSDCMSSDETSFIKLKRSNCIINYSIQIDVINYLTIGNSCSISLGIRERDSCKIRIIKGSKNIFDLLNDKFTVNSSVLYSAENGDELCLIAEINNKVKINPHKSIIKILLI